MSFCLQLFLFLFPALWSLTLAFSGSTVSSLPSGSEINSACLNPDTKGSKECLGRPGQPRETSSLDDLSLTLDGTNIQAQIQTDGNGVVYTGQMGLNLPPELGQASSCTDGAICWNWGATAKLIVDKSADDACYNVKWETRDLASNRDCVDISSAPFWFGGPEEYYQHFPLQSSNSRDEAAYVPGDMLQDKEKFFGGVVRQAEKPLLRTHTYYMH